MTSFRARLGILVLAGAFSACATGSALRQAQMADDLHDYDVAVASYTKALRENPRSKDAELGLERAKLRASDAHFARGHRFHEQGRADDAIVELQIATELNPSNAAAAQELRTVQVERRAQLDRPEGMTALEALLARTRDLMPAAYEVPNVTLPAEISTGQQSTTRTVYLTLARLANLSVTFDQQFRDGPAPASLLLGMTLRQALDAVATSTATFYQMVGPNAFIVIPDNPVKRREYTDEVVRQFTVQNADLKETIDALRVVTDARFIAPVSGTNAILVRDTPERVQIIGRLLSAFDKARPEVVVDVEVMEVDRTRLQEYGVQIASPGSAGINGTADVNQTNGISLQTLRMLSQADVLMTNIPALYYRLLKDDSRTRTLANPHLRITDGTTAAYKFGQDVPVPSLTITPLAQGGTAVQPQTQFTYRTIGVNLGITPHAHPDDEVTLTLNIELSSLGAPGFDGLPTFGSRQVSTAIRLKDGETNILAGLIREDERTEKQSLPGLGSIPVLGDLFSQNHHDAQQTDVVIMLTPHIVRGLNLAEEDLRPLILPREGGGASPLLEPAPGPTPAPSEPAPPRAGN